MRQRTMLLAALALTACDAGPSLDDAGDVRVDGGREVRDATVRDAGGDSGFDGGVLDAFVPIDAGRDSGADSGRDAGRRDSGADAGCTGICCGLFEDAACAPDLACRYQFDGGMRTGTACERAGFLREGDACEPFDGGGDPCQAGLYCGGLRCRRYCRTDDDCPSRSCLRASQHCSLT